MLKSLPRLVVRMHLISNSQNYKQIKHEATDTQIALKRKFEDSLQAIAHLSVVLLTTRC